MGKHFFAGASLHETVSMLDMLATAAVMRRRCDLRGRPLPGPCKQCGRAFDQRFAQQVKGAPSFVRDTAARTIFCRPYTEDGKTTVLCYDCAWQRATHEAHNLTIVETTVVQKLKGKPRKRRLRKMLNKNGKHDWTSPRGSGPPNALVALAEAAINDGTGSLTAVDAATSIQVGIGANLITLVYTTETAYRAARTRFKELHLQAIEREDAKDGAR